MQGLYDQAEPPMRRAVAISEATFGKNHSYISFALTNLAIINKHQGSYERAEQLFQRALSIRETTLGKNHPSLRYLLRNFANLYRDQGAYERAEPLYRRTLAIWSTLGVHRFEAPVLNDLALLRLAQHRRAEAVTLFARAFTLSEARLRKEALGLSESRLASFLQMLRSDEERLYSVLRAYRGDPGVRRLALTAALLLKGRSLDELADTSRTIHRSLDTRDHDAFARLRSLRTQITRLSLDSRGQTTLDDSQRLMDLAEQGDALEADLATRSAPLRALNALPPPGDMVDRVAATLPRDAALVELVAYVDRPLVPGRGTPRSKIPDQLCYLMLVLFPDGRIRAVDLGPAAPIDSAASRLRDTLASRDAGYQDAAVGLYRLVFKPLLPLLGNIRKLFVAPDGQLALVPIAALHDGHQFLADTFDFTYLTSGRDLLPRPDGTPPSTSVAILADPDYGMAPAAQEPAPDGGVAIAMAERSHSVERFFSGDRADL
jgi:tetratricopeptide (TPR) repeat protein